jgi:hypothetical protein
MIGYWFESTGHFQTKLVDQEKQQDIDDRAALYCCAVCHQKITSESAAISVEGEHAHVKINPDGRRFLLRCFSAVTGCRKSGEPTMYFSWFSGYRWQFVHCTQCGAQLGWFFNGKESFFALIKEQLIGCDNN